MKEADGHTEPHDDFAQALAAVTDPTTRAKDLAGIASQFPALRGQVAVHPHAYPQLLDWLESQGDPSVSQIVAARRGSSTSADSPATTHSTKPNRKRRGRRLGMVIAGAVALAVLAGGTVCTVANSRASQSHQNTTHTNPPATPSAAPAFTDPRVRWHRSLTDLFGKEASGPDNGWAIKSAWPATGTKTVIVTGEDSSSDDSQDLATSAVDEASGKVLWTLPGVKCAGVNKSTLVCVDYSEVPANQEFGTEEPELVFIDPQTGKTTKTGTKTQAGEELAIQGANIYSGTCNSDNDTVSASRYSPDGGVMWRQQIASPGKPAGGGDLSVSDAGVIVSCDSRGYDWTDGGSGVFAASDGRSLPVAPFHAVSWLPNQRILASTPNSEHARQTLVGLNAQGKEEWTYANNALMYSHETAESPVFISECPSSTTCGPQRLDPDTGKPMWKTADRLLGTSALSMSNDLVVLKPDMQSETADYSLMTIDGSTGKVLWSVPKSEPGTTAALVTTDLVLTTDKSNRLVGFDRKSGNKLWGVPIANTENNELTLSESGCIVTSRSEVTLVG